MRNEKCLLGTIASYSLDVKLAVGDAAACAAIALTPSPSKPSVDARAVARLSSEQFERKFALEREELSVPSASS
jgi:hypothetical protein